MMAFAICAAFYVGIPVLALLISGRRVTWQGWVVIILLWPIAWMFTGPEELP